MRPTTRASVLGSRDGERSAALAVWHRARELAGDDVAPPPGGCLAVVSGRPGLLVPVACLPDVPVAGWPIRNDERDSGVTLGEMEHALLVLRPARADGALDDQAWTALGRYLVGTRR